MPEDGFADVPEDSAYEPAVDCVVHWKIANGLTPTSYGPDAIVTRVQMASFLARLLDVTHGHLPPTDVDHFSDDDAWGHAPSIDRLAAVGIVGGRGGGRYEHGHGARHGARDGVGAEALLLRGTRSGLTAGAGG